MSFVVVVLAVSLANASTALATCAYTRIEIQGRITELGGDPLEGASLVAFVDRDPEAVVDITSNQDVWHTDPSGAFLIRGVFVDYAFPRWWHRFSSTVDHCGREPRSVTVVVKAEGFFARQVVVLAEDGAIAKLEQRSKFEQRTYRVSIEDPIELLRRSD